MKPCAGCGRKYLYSRGSGHGFKFCRDCLAAVPVCGLCGMSPSVAHIYELIRHPRYAPYICRKCWLANRTPVRRAYCSRCGKRVYKDSTSAEAIVCQLCRRLSPELRVDPAEQQQRKLDRSRERKRRIKGAGEPWDGVRDEVIYERDGWECQVPDCACPDGRRIDPGLEAGPWRRNIDHVIPLVLGGGDTAANKRAAHASCNARRRPGPDAWASC